MHFHNESQKQECRKMDTQVQIKDIYEFKYIPKSSTDERLINELREATSQVRGYRIAENNDYRAITVVFKRFQNQFD